MDHDNEVRDEIVDLGAASVETQGPRGDYPELGVIANPLGLEAE